MPYLKRLSIKVRKSSLLCGFASTTLWGALSKLLTLLGTFYCSNVLTKEGFGEYSFVKNTLNMILLICATNFSSLATKFATESLLNRDSLKRLIILSLFVLSASLLCGIAVVVLPANSIQSFTGGECVAHFVKVAGLFLPVFILWPLISAIFRGYKEFNRVGIYETTTSFFYLIFTVIGIYFWNYKGAIYAMLTYYLSNSILGVTLLWRYNRKRKNITCVANLKSQRAVIWTMIIPVFLMSFVEVPLTWMAQVEMGRRASYAMVGSLSVILSIRYILQILPTYFYQSFIPHATHLFAIGRHSDYFRKYRHIAFALFALLLVLIPLLSLFGKTILSLYGRAYIDQYPSFIISLAIIPLSLFSVLLKTNMIIREHQRLMLWMTITSSAAFIFSFYGFIALDVNALNAYLYAQGIQFAVQLLYGLSAFIFDQKSSLQS